MSTVNLAEAIADGINAQTETDDLGDRERPAIVVQLGQNVAQAMAAGLAICPTAREAGRRDAREGRPWSPPAGSDLLAYALGYMLP